MSSADAFVTSGRLMTIKKPLNGRKINVGSSVLGKTRLAIAGAAADACFLLLSDVD